ncbi:AEC family transporter [Ligilactobacillus sp. LYQ112]|uniref:AEC family transporter n=1 Tax=Ligilactobacillus sp. LYQ112 TaxID=3391060 RepID=UPI003983A7AB
MAKALIAALIPVIFTIMFGFFSGYIKSFDKKVPAILNMVVMNYALPLSLFFALNQMPKEKIFANWRIVMWEFVMMVGWWFGVYFFSKYVLRSSTILSIIRALALSTPAILFVGPALLTPLFPGNAAIAISIGGLMLNAVQLPLTMLALTLATIKKTDNLLVNVGQVVINGLKKPVIVGAFVGLVTALLGWRLPALAAPTFEELGKAAAGLGLFSIGLILWFNKPSFSGIVWFDVIVKELVMPLSVMVIMMLCGESRMFINEMTMTMMISQMIFPTIFSQQYGEGEQEMPSAMFLTTIGSFFALMCFIILRGISL